MTRLVPPSAAIVRRELVSHLRRYRSFVCLFLLTSAACAVVASQWPPEHTLQDQCGSVAQVILMMMSYLLLGGCALLLPPLGAATIVSEREQNTLDMLRGLPCHVPLTSDRVPRPAVLGPLWQWY